MSNATPHSQNQGDNKRRRSRGGQNRRNNNQHSRGQDRDSNYDRDKRGQGPNRSSNTPGGQIIAPLRKYAPVKLTWWQKLLQLIGLYKAPARPGQRPTRQPDAAKPAADSKVKSNTRNLRTSEGEAPPTGPRRERSRERDADQGPARGNERSRGGNRDSVESPRVYVGNLSYDVTENDLQELFKGIGGVRNVEIVYNRSTHRSKGFGFVEMLHMDEAKRAVEVLHDQPFMGRKLTVSGAQSKGQDEREDKDEREERQERRPRPTPVVAAAAPVVTAESLEASAEITTIIEPATVHEARVEVAPDIAEPAAPDTDSVAPAAPQTATDATTEAKPDPI